MSRPLRYYVHSSDGQDYSVGLWKDGTYTAGSRDDAIREYELLDEPGSYVWGQS